MKTELIVDDSASMRQVRSTALSRGGYKAGVKAWMVKPFQPQVLLDAVAKLALP